MAFLPGSNDTVLNGVTEVTIVSAPGASVQRVVKGIVIQNRDTIAHTVTLRYVSASGTRQIDKVTLSVDDTYKYGGTEDPPLVLDTTGKSIRAVCAEAVAVSNPDVTTTWADMP